MCAYGAFRLDVLDVLDLRPDFFGRLGSVRIVVEVKKTVGTLCRFMATSF
jgi:hypothetical protein